MRKRECRRMRNTRRLTNVDVFQKYFSLFPLNIYPFALSFFLYIFSVFVCLFGCVCACNLLPQLKSIDLLNSNLKHGIQWIACVARTSRILMLLLFVLLVGWLVDYARAVVMMILLLLTPLLPSKAPHHGRVQIYL